MSKCSRDLAGQYEFVPISVSRHFKCCLHTANNSIVVSAIPIFTSDWLTILCLAVFRFFTVYKLKPFTNSNRDAGHYVDRMLQLLARLHCKPPLTCLETTLLPDTTAQRSVYELCGPEGCGKTQLLLHLVVNAILPRHWRGVDIAGLCVGVVYVDLDYKFNMIRLTTILETRIQGALSVSGGDQDPSQVEELIKQCLSRLYVVRCSSSSQFLITLHSLETLLGNNPDISLLVIDSVSEFYWIDRSVSGGTSGRTNTNKLMAEALRKLLNTYNLVVFCAKAELFEQRDNPDRGHQDFMGPHWSRLVTHRWTLAKTRPIRVGGSGQVQNCYCVTVNDTQRQLSFLISNRGVKFIT